MLKRCSCPRATAVALVLGVTTLAAGSATASGLHAIDHVRAITNPFFNETPAITTELRPVYMFNWIPSDFVSDGGYINVVGIQARWAVTDRFGVIVTKNGYTDAHFDELLPDADGPVNVAFGAKYALIARPELARFLTVGGRYEAPAGDVESGLLKLQGGGNGLFDMFMSWGSMVGERTGIQSSAGLNLALDMGDDTSSFHYSFHLDHEILDGWTGVFEGNVITTIDEGDRTDSSILGSFEGFDLFNFGSTSSGTVTTLAVGSRYRLNDHMLFGAAYEFPVTSRKDIIGSRLTLDMVLSF